MEKGRKGTISLIPIIGISEIVPNYVIVHQVASDATSDKIIIIGTLYKRTRIHLFLISCGHKVSPLYPLCRGSVANVLWIHLYARLQAI